MRRDAQFNNRPVVGKCGLHAFVDPVLERTGSSAIDQSGLAKLDAGYGTQTDRILDAAALDPAGNAAHVIALKLDISANRALTSQSPLGHRLLLDPEWPRPWPH